jgi:serine/threonine protein kinase
LTQPIPFGKYYLLERINVGGMAEVFKAKAFGVEGFERLVAVKRILPNIAEDEEFITMFIDEAKIAVQLQHANVAQIFDLGKVDDSYFIALEYVHGKDLRAVSDHLKKQGQRMPTPQACFVIMQICEGLDYAHNKKDGQGRDLNLVHRDVSPQNILLGYEGELKIVDFGIAKAAGKASKTQAGILKGKFGYMSPEQVRGLPVDRRSDIFALGIVLYELLTGERLFVGESDFSTLEKVRNVEILPPSSFNDKISPELERIVLKALAKDADDRYQNAIDLHDDLQAYLYKVGEFYSRKDLGAWMKKMFGDELNEENAKNAQYEQLEEPTPAPPPGAVAAKAASRSGKSGMSGLPGAATAAAPEWDEEEVETAIYDRAPEGAGQSQADRDAELTSADIMLQELAPETEDDKTAIAPPPEDLLADSGGGPFSLHGRAGGPPPGLSAYRHTPAAGAPVGNPWPGAGGQSSPPGNDGRPSPFRQTLMGMPQSGLSGGMPLPGAMPMNTPGGTPAGGFPPPSGLSHSPYGSSIPAPSPYPERRPLSTFTEERRGGGTTIGVIALVALALAGLLAYKYFSQPGKLQIVVNPADAVIALEGVPLAGPPPITVQKPHGTYRLSVSRQGYVPIERPVVIQNRQSERLEVQLEPSPDTGFELTSDPPGQLVWLDDQAFTGKDPNGPQARTGFKAYPVTPGRHVLEIKGDAHYKPWRHEFLQEPGKTLKIAAQLEPIDGKPARPVTALPVPAPRPETPKPEAPRPPPIEAPKPAPKPVAEIPKPAPKPPIEAPKPAPKPVAETPRPEAPKPAPKPVAEAPKPAPKPPAETPKPVAETPKPRPAPKPTHKPDEAVAAAPAAAGGDCVITIGSRPWAEVWLDGKNTQKLTPLVDFKVPCGKHKLTLKNSDVKVDKSETVTVKAGEKFKKVFQLLESEE